MTGTRTPVQAWEADQTPLRPVEEEKLFWLLPSDVKPRKVYGFGVRFNNENYFALELLDRVDQELEVRYLPGSTSQIWLGEDDEFVCIAKRWDIQPPAVFRSAIERRDDEHAGMEELLAKAGRSEQEPQTDEERAPDLSEELLRRIVAAAAAAAAQSDDGPPSGEAEEAAAPASSEEDSPSVPAEVSGFVRQLAEQLGMATEEDEEAAAARAAEAVRHNPGKEKPRKPKRSRFDRVNEPVETTRHMKEEQS